jgi:hypothetical protein
MKSDDDLFLWARLFDGEVKALQPTAIATHDNKLRNNIFSDYCMDAFGKLFVNQVW